MPRTPQPVPTSAEVMGTGGNDPIPDGGIWSMVYAYLFPEGSYVSVPDPYDWWEWRFLPNPHWIIKQLLDPTGTPGPYSRPVLCGMICTAAGLDVEGTYEHKARLAVDALLALWREDQA